MRIAQVGATDQDGGASAVAMDLHAALAAAGHDTRYFVGTKRQDDAGVELLLDEDTWPWRLAGYTPATRALRRAAGRHPNRGFGLAARTLRLLTHPRALAERMTGHDSTGWPAATRAISAYEPDIVHAHNLHGGYIDLASLEHLSPRAPVVVTLHDMWLLTGHCAHAMSCDRWMGGCGECPDLRREPAIARDATKPNLARKQRIVMNSRVHAVAPSHWMRACIERSRLAPHFRSVRVIPNGVDTEVFASDRREPSRAALGLPADAFIVMLTVGSKGSMWKDDRMLRDTAAILAARPNPRPVIFLAVGRHTAVVDRPDVRTIVVDFQADRTRVARYYQAADVYLQASRADTFPLAVLESLSCGTPVVATNVGGIPEQVCGTSTDAVAAGTMGSATGMLVDRGDSRSMAEAVATLMAHEPSRAQMGRNASTAVAERFTLKRQAQAYLQCYQEISTS